MNPVPWRQRLLAMALLIAVGASGYVLIEQVWLGKYAFYQSHLLDMRDRLLRFGRAALERPVLEAQAVRLREDQSVGAQLLPQASPNLAATDLQQRLRASVDRVGALLVSTQVLPTVAEGEFQRVGVRGQVNAELTALPRLLHGLEASRPLLFVDNVQMAGQRRAVARTRPGVRRGLPEDAQLETRVVVQFDLYGYMRSLPGDAGLAEGG